MGSAFFFVVEVEIYDEIFNFEIFTNFVIFFKFESRF